MKNLNVKALTINCLSLCQTVTNNGLSFPIFRSRNIAVCKIFKQDDNEDWLGCDRCGQFFLASCLGVDVASTLCQTQFLLHFIIAFSV